MAETRYIISDAARMIDVEPHVLRYWEEELAIEIPRNELGHRYYTDREIRLFENIRDLKDKGFQLKAIKLIIKTLNEDAPFGESGAADSDQVDVSALMDAQQPDNGIEQTALQEAEGAAQENKAEQTVPVQVDAKLAAVTSEDKMKHFKYIMDAIVTEALQNNNQYLEEAMIQQVTDVVVQELGQMEQRQEQQSEKYYKLLDETIRGKQRDRLEVAAARVPAYGAPRGPRRRKGLFRRRYKY